MTLNEAIKAAGVANPHQLANFLEISSAAIYQWDEREIPELRAYEIKSKTSQLKAKKTSRAIQVNVS